MNHRLYYCCSLFSVVLALASASWGQWSSDPNTNLALADIPGADQVQPKLAVLPDNSWYVSWFNNNPNDPPPQGYDTYLQRLNAAGIEQLPHNGVPVAILSNSFTEDYGLAVDSRGNALLAFLDTREGANWQVTATKVAPNGQPLWGSNGVQLTSGNPQAAAPKIVATSDGGIVVAWTGNSAVFLQKLDGDGRLQWQYKRKFNHGIALYEANANYSLCDLHAADEGSVIVSFSRDTGFFSDRHLYTNKISSTGALLWGANHVKVWDGGSLQLGNYPPFLSDGNGGAIFAWYSSRPSLQSYVQHIRADGSEAFAHNGVPASTNTIRVRVDPSASYHAANGDIFLFWEEENSLQSMSGIFAQRFDSTGVRKWGKTGRRIVPLGSNSEILPTTVQVGDGVLAFWIDQSVTQIGTIQAIRLDRAGHTVCSQFPVASAISQKGKMWSGIAPSGLTALAFQDYRNGNSDLYIQNVNTDCSLGTQTHVRATPMK